MELRTDHAALDEIAQFYVFRRGADNSLDVAHFVGQYPYVAEALLEARGQLQRIFPKAPYYVQIKRDPDINDEQLILSIGVKRDPTAPHDGVKRLLRLQEEWGLDANRRTEGKLAVILESL